MRRIPGAHRLHDLLGRGTRRRVLALAGIFVLGGAVALLALGLVPATRGEVGPGTIELRGRWSFDGRTELEVPPLGSVVAETHLAPLAVEAAVQRLDFQALQGVVTAERPTESLYEVAEDDIRSLIRSFLLRSTLAGAVVGALAAALVSHRRLLPTAVGMLGGAVAVLALLASTWRGYDQQAFAQPRYLGALEAAPEVLDIARRHLDQIDRVRARVGALSAQVSDLYAAASSPLRTAPESDDDVVILHVSDIHLNPVGVEVTRRLATSFAVDAVLDTGDLTSFGASAEGLIGELVDEIPVRYLFVPGNHDSSQNRAALAAAPNVELLDGEPVEVRGLEILGVADPTFTAFNEITSDEAAEIRLDHAARVRRLARVHRPHVLAVHDPRLASEAAGSVPTVVAGHLHQRSSETSEGTISLVVGSTGATGLGSLDLEEGSRYEAQILRFDEGCLSAVDYVRLEGIGGSFELDRRTHHLRPAGRPYPWCVEAEPLRGPGEEEPLLSRFSPRPPRSGVPPS